MLSYSGWDGVFVCFHIVVKWKMKKPGRHFICIGVEGNAIIDSASEVFDDIQSRVNMCRRWIVVVCGKEGNDRSEIWPGIGREPAVDTPNHTLILFPSSEECMGWHFGLDTGMMLSMGRPDQYGVA